MAASRMDRFLRTSFDWLAARRARHGTASVDVVIAGLVAIPHRSAVMRRKSVSVDIHDVDVARTKSDLGIQQTRTRVDQCVRQAFDDLGVTYAWILRHAGFACRLCEEFFDLFIPDRIAPAADGRIVTIEPLAGFLSEPLAL